jgi:salicylate hydroxylase
VSASDPVLIGGGGIGGLALALALAKRGLASVVLERREAFSAEGAGIQLGPNATGVLQRLGVADRLSPQVGRPECLSVRSGLSGRLLAELPLGRWIEKRHGAPYWVAHRADLQTALLDSARRESLIALATASEVTGFSQEGGRLLVSVGGGTLRGRALVGADGLHSAVRERLFPSARPVYAGKIALRALLPAERAPARLRAAHVGVWLAPFGHVVHYPIRRQKMVALVAVIAAQWPGSGWSLEVAREEVRAALMPFAGELRALLEQAQEWRRWALYDALDLPRWSSGRVTLLGDAAHPVLPFLAQGGALAIEDAETLAGCLAGLPDPVQALARYEALRRPRARRIQDASRRNGVIYHLGGLPAAARDLVLQATPAAALMAAFDWVYGWKGDAVGGEAAGG